MPIVALVDDDSIYQFTATRIIESAKLASQILHFEDGSEALKYLRENALTKENLPDHLFLDINMPLVNGWMFLQEYIILKPNLAKDIQIYMVSSSIDQRDRNRAKEFSEIKEFVVKPVAMESFSRILKETA